MEKHSTTNAFIIKNGFGIRKISVLMEKHSTTDACPKFLFSHSTPYALIIKNGFGTSKMYVLIGKTLDHQCTDY